MELPDRPAQLPIKGSKPIRPRRNEGVLLRLPVDLHRKLRQLALDEDTSLQMLGLEALEQMLENRRR